MRHRGTECASIVYFKKYLIEIKMTVVPFKSTIVAVTYLRKYKR